MKTVLVIVASYLIGSIPFSLLASKAKGADPRQAGTKNVGATNALVVAGPIAGAVALFGDIGKGIAAIYLARYFSLTDWGIVFCGLAAVIGHDFSIFLRFKGGKGIAATGGVLLALDPIFGIITLLLWILTMFLFRYFIPSTILVLCFVPVMMWMASWRGEYITFGILSALLAIYAHRQDLKRYFAGDELTIQESLAKYRKK
ncbi:MAG: glycerol-3-phosphate 1-O-acyltransferase PlsY [Candidatus Margulisbacteria bacterium]|nr:glycerol-3-phosphate 1-O-acyltransferase PlsY [Candidatus Margulisiibacteriota bacterium]